MTSVDPTARPWWEPGVIYQVYPRSFQDSNGDGIGDLAGIATRLEHLAWLGVDAIWISPIFRSPMADFGYDVADYRDIDPVFGTLADFDRLVEAAHARGIRVLLDFVPNHSSDLHPWFLESRSSRANPRRDWYLWADPAPGGGPPNNWLSVFGGSAWEWDEPTGQFYYHAFTKEQPDLNWRNPDVRAEMYDVLRFWLDRGVDGFRVDVMWHLVKDDQLRDNPPDPDWTPDRPGSSFRLQATYTTDRPETMDIVADMRAVLDEFGDRVLIGEIYLPYERLVAYYGSHPDRPGAHLPFNFRLLLVPWQAARDHGGDHRLRGRAPGARLAQLGAGQPRPAAARVACRPGAGAGRRDAPADAARHAHALLRRRARHGGRADPAGARAGPRPVRRAERRARPGAHADALGRLARGRVHRPGRRGCPWAATSSGSTSPRSATTRRRRCTSTVRCSRCGGPRPRCRSGPGRR